MKLNHGETKIAIQNSYTYIPTSNFKFKVEFIARVKSKSGGATISSKTFSIKKDNSPKLDTYVFNIDSYKKETWSYYIYVFFVNENIYCTSDKLFVLKKIPIVVK